jgi:hypothetical protein
VPLCVTVSLTDCDYLACHSGVAVPRFATAACPTSQPFPRSHPFLWMPSRVGAACLWQLRALFSGNGLSQPQSLHRDSTFPGMW